MRTELYSVRSSVEELSYINSNLKSIATAINEKAGIKILYKTEIDCNAKKIKTDLYESFEAANPPELHIFLNALDSKDISSFYSLFSPFIETIEKDLYKKYDSRNTKTQSYPHIKIHPLSKQPSDYPAYCFTFKRRKFLVLPRITLVGADLVEYVSSAVLEAKEIFTEAFDSCPDGYVYSSEKPVTKKDKFFATIKGDKAKGTAPVASIPKAEKSVPVIVNTAPDNIEVTPDITEPQFVFEGKTTPKAPAEKKPAPMQKERKLPKEEPVFFDEEITPAPAAAEKARKAKDDKKSAKEKSVKDKSAKDQPVKSKDKKEKPAKEKANKKQGSVKKASKKSDTKVQESKNNDADSSNIEKKESRLKSFFKSFIPMKGDTKKSIFLKILVLVAIVTFLAGGFLLLKFYVIDPTINDQTLGDIRSVFHSSSPDETIIRNVLDEDGSVKEVEEKVDSERWNKMKKINEEIVAWVQVENTGIDHPVLFHKGDNDKTQYYLYLDYNKKYSDFGSIFLDYHCGGMADSRHVILHGHNMGSDKDAMFGSLVNYTIKDGRTKANPEYYKSHPIIKYDTPKQNGDWIIFAAMKIDVANDKSDIFNYLQAEFNDAQYMNFIYNIKERSYFDIDVPINENDRLLTLSTCSYETDNMRTVIVARKIRDGEDVSSYIKSAKGKTPVQKVSSSFEAELKNLTWYDGNGKLKGDGTLEFMEQKEMFTVKFYDAYGKVIRTEKVLKGEDAVGIVGQTPIKESDDTYHYRFIGWDTKYTNVQKDLHVKPKYDRTPIIDEVVDPNDVPTTTPEDNTTESTPSTNPTVPSVPSTTPEPSTPSGSSTDEASPT